MTIIVQFGLAIVVGVVLGLAFCVTKLVFEMILRFVRKNNRERTFTEHEERDIR